ncbi:MAG: hypothetical protein HW410_891 [Nitrosarchaeum sp.]|nr:hypothetical protein [Nitrosarchaeum sp.]
MLKNNTVVYILDLKPILIEKQLISSPQIINLQFISNPIILFDIAAKNSNDKKWCSMRG